MKNGLIQTEPTFRTDLITEDQLVTVRISVDGHPANLNGVVESVMANELVIQTIGGRKAICPGEVLDMAVADTLLTE